MQGRGKSAGMSLCGKDWTKQYKVKVENEKKTIEGNSKSREGKKMKRIWKNKIKDRWRILNKKEKDDREWT